VSGPAALFGDEELTGRSDKTMPTTRLDKLFTDPHV
jgi:hypothetical protein